jgi:hypothetical protein
VYLDDLAQQIRTEVPAGVLPAADTEQLFRLYALLALVKGEAVEARDVHDAWVVWMRDRGEQHRSMVPFEELSPEVQREDEPFVEAIRRAVSRRSRHSGQ